MSLWSRNPVCAAQSRCGDAAYITGHALVVDGGLTIGSLMDPNRIRAMAEDILKK
jgi:hypothetical protein